MPERETLTCHPVSGLLSSWRVAALTFITGISCFLVLGRSPVPQHTVTCAVLASAQARCSNSCAVRALGDNATRRSSAFCHYIAPQKGLSPSAQKTHHLPLTRDSGPTTVSFPMRTNVLICGPESRESSPAQAGRSPVTMARRWLGSGSAVTWQWPWCSTCWWPLEDGAALRRTLLQAGWPLSATVLSHSSLLPTRFAVCGGLGTSLIHPRAALKTSCASPTLPGQLHRCGSFGLCITKIVY